MLRFKTLQAKQWIMFNVWLLFPAHENNMTNYWLDCTESQIKKFLHELRTIELTNDNFKLLYEKYPKVRVGIRRALVHIGRKI